MPRLLIVDDEETILRSMGVLFKCEGYDIVSCRDSQQAADILRSTDPIDLMMTDIRMAPLSGMDLLKLAAKVRPGMPTIVVSAYASDKTIQDSYDLGCVAYIRKPFNVNEVIETVRKSLQGAPSS